MDAALVFPVGLEEGRGGAALVHSLSVPGCVAAGSTKEDALAAFPEALAAWLDFRAAHGAPVPPPEAELEIAVDEWVRTDADVAAGESEVCFDADLVPLTGAEIERELQLLGDLRGLLLRHLRRVPDNFLDQRRGAGWTVRQMADELARAQWWLLSRLGASPLAEVPERTLGRLDTAMALVVQQFTEMPAEARGRVVELEGEVWTPRKVLRRLLWVEWSLGQSALHALLNGE